MFSACGVRKPNVKEAPITEPWASMNLPCQDEGVVAFSNKDRFHCAYGGQETSVRDNETVTAYAEVFKRNGWKLTIDKPVASPHYGFEKDGKEAFINASGPQMFENGELTKWEGFGIQITLTDKK